MHLQRTITHFWWWNIFDNAIHQYQNIFSLGKAIIEPTIFATTIKSREIQLLFSGIQVEKQFKNCIMHFIGTAICFINLIDNHNWLQMQLQCFLQHKTSLWHGAFKSIHQKYNAIRHFQYTFHFTTKVTMARCVNHIYFDAVVGNSSVFGENGNATFLFKIIAVHDQFTCILIVTKYFCGL